MMTLTKKGKREGKCKKNNTREEIARPARPTRALQTSTRARTVANLDMERKTAGIPVEERMIIPPTEILAKARVNTQAKEKANTWVHFFIFLIFLLFDVFHFHPLFLMCVSFIFIFCFFVRSGRSKVTRVTVGRDTKVFEFVKRPQRSRQSRGLKRDRKTGTARALSERL